MTEIPKWLDIMRQITGTEEYAGAANNPTIMGWVKTIARAYPEMGNYASTFTGDDIAWCGLCVAYCCTMAGIRPPFQRGSDTDCFLWAESFASDPGYKRLGRPVPGAICVFTRSGGNHVTIFEELDDYGDYRCRGGNQSDEVNLSSYDPDTLVGIVWPKDVPVPQIPVEDRPMLEEGDDGPDVVDLQMMLNEQNGARLDPDGDFGSLTEQAVANYQRSRGLEIDGICGQETWGALYDEKPPLPPPEPPPGGLTAKQQNDLRTIARNSEIADYLWEDRGLAPSGWTEGMAVAFGQDYLRLQANHPALLKMTQARRNSDKDALNVYAHDYRVLGASNERAGVEVLINLFALMLGHGMRESSGSHCEGRDQSASNTSSTEAEAGAFQTSYNAAGASNPQFDRLMDQYLRRESPGYLSAFAQDVSCSSDDWICYGSGRGWTFQMLCKIAPAFSAESAALTLRNLCNHYGPIIREEVELKAEADRMLQDVQDYMDSSEVVA